MPYFTCAECGLPIYSAAAYATRDECPRCGTPIPPRRGLFVRDLPTAESIEAVVDDERARRSAGP
jgi:hypothetical protein